MNRARMPQPVPVHPVRVEDDQIPGGVEELIKEN